MFLSAGHVNTVMYLLNYYPGIDTEIKDCRGFTALIKAAMTGRNDVVAALVMAGMVFFFMFVCLISHLLSFSLSHYCTMYALSGKLHIMTLLASF